MGEDSTHRCFLHIADPRSIVVGCTLFFNQHNTKRDQKHSSNWRKGEKRTHSIMEKFIFLIYDLRKQKKKTLKILSASKKKLKAPIIIWQPKYFWKFYTSSVCM